MQAKTSMGIPIHSRITIIEKKWIENVFGRDYINKYLVRMSNCIATVENRLAFSQKVHHWIIRWAGNPTYIPKKSTYMCSKFEDEC